MKNILKISIKILLLFFALTLVNCEKDDNTNVLETKQDLTIKKVYFDEINQNNKLVQKLEGIKENKSLYSRGDNDSILDFTVNNEVANYVEYINGNHTYSFSINRLYETNKLENLLLISNNDNNYDSFIVDYNITEEEYENMQDSNTNESVVDFYPIDYDSSFLRNEQFNCTYNVHEWVYNNYSLWTYDITCTYNGSSGGESNENGNTGNDDSGNPSNGEPNDDASGTQGSGGPGTTGVNFNNPPIIAAPIVQTAAEQLASQLNMTLSELIDEVGVWINKDKDKDVVKKLTDFIKLNIQNNISIEEKQEFVINLAKVISEDTNIDNDALSFVLEAKNQDKIYNNFDSAFLNSVNQFTNIDLSDSENQDPVLIHYLTKCAVLKALNPTWSDIKVLWESTKDVIHISLDVFGLVPVVGEIGDLLNGGLYLLEGDGVNATLSFASAVPIGGWAPAGTKFAIKIVDASQTAYSIGTKVKLTWKVLSNGTIYFGSTGSKLRKVLGMAPIAIDARQAHHLMPWAQVIRNHSIIQKAAKSGSAFHMNEALNGIAVVAWRNQPNHPEYSNLVKSKLDEFNSINPNATVDEAYDFVSDLISDIRDWVINNPNSHLNDLVLP